ncbi:unnamed protein product [Bursaphelenchus okinawaensis]|uniref:Glutaredoxin domain-containing protein n=1 Tax=Bursaphelenchus okinawaensis TaxID=465554 RepID=A0A811K9A9_9BILA|nr:unnamed protein product [Bursaphelenchus okinawaensis]CAG9094622.1 unnamed protein product [Bursaphelenchus okinawaensis]
MLTSLFSYLERYGWYTLIIFAVLYVGYQKYLSDKLAEYQQNKELERQKKDDNVQRDKHKQKLEEVRRKQQEEYDAEVQREIERKKQLAEQRRLEKLEQAAKEKGGDVFNAMDFVNEQIASKKVVVFSKSWCPYSRKAKQVLFGIYRIDQKDYKVVELDELDTGDLIQDVLQRLTGGRSVPRVFVNGQFIGGGDDTERLHKENKMASLLKDANVEFVV